MGWRPMSLLLLLLLPSSSLREVKSLLARRKSAEAVVPLDRVMEQSACAPRETLVSVAVEYPGHPEFRYNPVCVAVLRCSGCCSDEMHECLAVATSKVTLEESNPWKENCLSQVCHDIIAEVVREEGKKVANSVFHKRGHQQRDTDSHQLEVADVAGGRLIDGLILQQLLVILGHDDGAVLRREMQEKLLHGLRRDS